MHEQGGEVGWVNVDGFFTNLHTTTTTTTTTATTTDDDEATNNNKNYSYEHLDAILREQVQCTEDSLTKQRKWPQSITP